MGKGISRLLAILLMALISLPAWASQVTYYHTDALGSVVMESNEAGQVVYQREYRPYGESTLDPPKDGPAYTGHVQDTATGLTYMQQRYYDPDIGRFLSVDPVTVDKETGRNFNRYWYANNNPYRFTDPDGRLAGDIGNETRESVQRNQQMPEDLSIVEAMASDVVAMVSETENWTEAAGEMASDVGDVASDALETGADLMQCAAGCTFDEFVGSDSSEMVENVGKDAAENLAEDQLEKAGMDRMLKGVQGLGKLNGWESAASSLTCTVECAHKSND